MTVDEVLSKYHAYQWENGTIDIVVPRSPSFGAFMKGYGCILCGTKFNLDGKLFSDAIHGIKIACPSCGQAWFIHEPV